jgi:cytochrome bd-type quinol oxidase subunit 2
MWHILAFLALFILCNTYALSRGGAPERLGAAVLITGLIATAAASTEYAGRFSSAEYSILFVDLVMTLAFAALAVHADRYWPMWMTAVIGFGLVAHLAQTIAPSIMPKVYATAHAFSAYPSLLILAWGTWRHRRRLKEYGEDPAWSVPAKKAQRKP